ncbi:MAG: hypothetical protein V1804_00315 [Patescibacteria group bacterium]
MRFRKVRSFINKLIKETGESNPAIEVVFKNGNNFCGYFWFSNSEHGLIDIAPNIPWKVSKHIQVRDIKELREPSVESMIPQLWNLHEVVEGAIEVGVRGRKILPFLK